MDSDKKFIIIWTAIILIVIGMSLFVVYSSEQECRARGGVPVTINGAVNCAKEGFIDYKI